MRKIEVRIITMRRSGHHGFAYWLMKHFTAPGVLFNNTKWSKSCQEWKANPIIYYDSKQNMQSQSGKYVSGEYSYVLFGLEDEDVDVFEQHPLDCTRQKSDQIYDVILLRDPFNLWASRHKKIGANVLIDDALPRNERDSCPGVQAVKRWTRHAQEFLKTDSSYLCVKFNQWFSDINYRIQLSQRFGLSFTDVGKERVLGMGGGSSFDKVNFNNCASKMKVLERWKEFEHDSDFVRFFDRHRCLSALSEQIFGFRPQEL